MCVAYATDLMLLLLLEKESQEETFRVGALCDMGEKMLGWGLHRFEAGGLESLELQ